MPVARFHQVYDVLNFDMIVMLKLTFIPGCAEWIYKVGPARGVLRGCWGC